jgi:hypothetical protein
MKLSKETQAILKNFASINPNMMFRNWEDSIKNV